MGSFIVGDWVAVLDEAASGRVTAVEGDMVTLITTEGFSLHYHAKDLVKMEEDITVSASEVAQAKKEKEPSYKKVAIRAKPKQRSITKLEVDLHAHQLIKSTRGLSAFAILNLQLETAKRQLEFALEKRISNVIFIHGVGEGVLKAELYSLFTKYDNLEFYDAEYQKYGSGATEVYIPPKG